MPTPTPAAQQKALCSSDELKHPADCFTPSEALMAGASNEQRLMHPKREEKFPLISNILFPGIKGTLSTLLSSKLHTGISAQIFTGLVAVLERSTLVLSDSEPQSGS